MPVNNMNVGVDYALSYYDGTTQSLVDLGDVQSVKITAHAADIESKPFNDSPRFGFVPMGYTIDFTITRTGSQLEDLMVTFEQNFNQGNVLAPGFLNQTINNPDGTTSRYQFTKFVVFLPEQGNIEREKVVTLQLKGKASTKVKLA
jgi:hypothetical protein